MSSSSDTAAPPARRRRISRTRRLFLSAIQAQITGTRVLAAITLVVLLVAGFAWLTTTTGSPVVGVYFIALAGALLVAVYWFIQVMRMFTGHR